MYTKTSPGDFDHVKWMADTQHVSSNGFPGYDAAPGRFPAPGATTIINHGGTPKLAAPRQLNCGMALFTLLDGGLPPSGQGLVEPADPYTFPGSFVFPTGSANPPNLFGKGVEMQVSRFEVDSAS